jgi:hypothetical protein
MQGKQAHLSDEELLLFSDQELPTGRASEAREHIAQCAACRRRLKELEAASADFADLHEQEIQTQGSSSLNARSLLQVRLSEASVRNDRSRPAGLRSTMTRQLASACLALLLVVGSTWAVRQMMRERATSDAMSAEAIALPRRGLTPGSSRAVQVADLCGSQDLDNDPPVNSSLEQAVFNEYGLPASAEKDYELDYLISPALGGVDDIHNLWPQPYSSTWNARVKDQLEDHLHQLVCQGKVQLTTAQNDIASDWIAAYKRYFNTDKPEPSTSTAASIASTHELKPNHRNPPRSHISAAYNLALVASSWQPSATMAMLRRTDWRR